MPALPAGMVILELFVELSWKPSVSKTSLLKVTAVAVALDIDCAVVIFSNWQPTKVEPLAGACHLSPVASAESATILQEQSQRIVLRY